MPDGAALNVDFATAEVFSPLWDAPRYPDDGWIRYLVEHGGRGSGKSHDMAARVVDRHLEGGVNTVCLREVQKDLKHSAKKLIEMKIKAFGLGAHFDPRQNGIAAPGDGSIIFQGMQEHTKESVKSLEDIDLAWIEEGQVFSHGSWEMLRPTMRKPGSQILVSMNRRWPSDTLDEFFLGPAPPARAVIVKANWHDNPWFTDELEFERQEDFRLRRHRYAHVWEGEHEPMVAGAIWDQATINAHRRRESPELEELYVAIDPSVSPVREAHERSNECGIVIGGRGPDGHGYILEDWSLVASPATWARRAVTGYDAYDADGVVIEVNQGGAMCRDTVRSVRNSIPVIEVHASRGKHVRAAPVAALYEQGLVHHVGTFPELELQMCQTTHAGYEGEGSPDRLDALVWLLTQLFPSIAAGQGGGARTVQADRSNYTPRTNIRRR